MRTIRLDQLGAPAHEGGDKFNTQFHRKLSTTVVIQETPTGRYWKSSGLWTPDVAAATSFRTASAALEQATHLKLQNVQLVLTRETMEREVIPIRTSIRC